MNALAPPPDLTVIESDEAISAFGQPVRRRVLEALAESPDSATGLAARLDDSRQRINYHVRALEDAGLVELAEERPRRGLTENIYRPVSRRFAIDPAVLGNLDAGQVSTAGDRWAAAYAIALASRATREIAALRRKAEAEDKRLAVASLDTTVHLPDPKAMMEFVDDLAQAIGEVVARHDAPGPDSRAFRLSACSYPAPEDATTPDH